MSVGWLVVAALFVHNGSMLRLGGVCGFLLTRVV